MLESFLLKKASSIYIGSPGPYPLDPNAVFDIDLTQGTVGSQVITERVANKPMTRTLVSGSGDGYVDHPVYGRCYFFNGNVLFRNATLLGINSYNYELTAEFMTFDTTTNMVVFETGDYPSSPNMGSQFAVNQYPATYVQYFQTNSSGAYRRCLLNGTNDGGMNVIKIRKDANGVTVSNVIKGTSVTNAAYNTGGDTTTRICGTTANTALFKGWIRRISLVKLT